ncbi:Uncharacterized protein Rs2_29078 [Raphanus sativus]|nr:Uncharacterized protein Rs2_29078 [Raphanus sativus]
MSSEDSVYSAQWFRTLTNAFTHLTLAGKLFLNATSGTHFYFDCESSVGKEHFEKLVGDGSNASSLSKVVPAQKTEPLTVSELNQCVLTVDPQGNDHGPDDNGDGAELSDVVTSEVDEGSIVNNQPSASTVPVPSRQAANKRTCQ